MGANKPDLYGGLTTVRRHNRIFSHMGDRGPGFLRPSKNTSYLMVLLLHYLPKQFAPQMRHLSHVGRVFVRPVDRNLGCVFLDIVLQMLPHRDQISLVGGLLDFV